MFRSFNATYILRILHDMHERIAVVSLWLAMRVVLQHISHNLWHNVRFLPRKALHLLKDQHRATFAAAEGTSTYTHHE